MAFAVPADIPADTKAAISKGGVQVTIFGDLRFRGTWLKNTQDFSNEGRAPRDASAAAKTITGALGPNNMFYNGFLNNNIVRQTIISSGATERSLFESRIRLGFDIAANANTTGRILLEAGANNTMDNMPWGASNAGIATRGASGNNGLVPGDSKGNEMRILEAWLQHKGSGLFGVPAYFKIGHMPIRVGNGIFYSHTRFNDDAIVMGIEPIKGFNADFAYVKNAENNIMLDDDADTYSLMLNYHIAKNSKIGADVSYFRQQNGGPLLQPALLAGNTVTPNTDLWNIGINAKTDLGINGLERAIDGAYQTGKMQNIPFGVGGLAEQQVDLEGWAMTFDASYKFDPVKISLGFGYGSGQDDDIVPGKEMKNKTFQTSLESIPHYTFVYEYFTPNAANMTWGGLANTMYLRLKAEADITKELYADLSVYYLRAVKNNANTNPYGWAGKDAAIALTRAGLANLNNDSKDIGIEIDANIKYKIDKNLTYYIEGGYLFAGDFWKNVTGPVNNGGIWDWAKVDDAYAVRSGFQLTF
jgi:hypothetical protein